MPPKQKGRREAFKIMQIAASLNLLSSAFLLMDFQFPNYIMFASLSDISFI